jgi:hypothetical protein
MRRAPGMEDPFHDCEGWDEGFSRNFSVEIE